MGPADNSEHLPRTRQAATYDPTVADTSPHIGTLREKALHASLKSWYQRPGDRVEVPIEGYVIDLVRRDLLIEIQTTGFSSLKSKVVTLLDKGHRLRIVHPIPSVKWIVKLGPDGAIVDRRQSPKHGQVVDIFAELVSFPRLLRRDGLEIEVLMTLEEERRRHEPGKAWRRRGWVVVERALIDVESSTTIDASTQLVDLLPEDLPERFTTADLAERLGIRRRTAQQMAYCLRAVGVISPLGKRGRAVEFRIGDPTP